MKLLNDAHSNKKGIKTCSNLDDERVKKKVPMILDKFYIGCYECIALVQYT